MALINNEHCLSSSIIEHHDYSADEILDIAKEAIVWKKSSIGIEQTEDLFSSELVREAGTSIIDWYAMAIGRLGYDDNYLAYLTMVEENVSERYKTEDKLDKIKATEWHRIGMAILSAGGDPTSLQTGSINLVADGSYNRGQVKPLLAQGNNAFYWALLMMDALRYEIPADAVDGRNDIIFAIIKGQQADGGFGQNGVSTPDMTAMAIQALAPYYNNETRYKYIRTVDKVEFSRTVREVIDEALEYLSDAQYIDGSFRTDRGDSCEDNAQVIIALCSLGIDPALDARFHKEGFTVIDAIMNFRQTDGGFAHSLTGNNGDSDTMATGQALLALAAIVRNDDNRRTVFDFRIELNDGIREQLFMLDEAIEMLSDDASTSEVEMIYQQYRLIPVAERSYIRNYHKLADRMQELEMINDSETLVGAMNQHINGDGYIIDLRDGSQVIIAEPFTKEDEEKVLALPKKITSENAHMVTILLHKLKSAPNRGDYEQIEVALTEKQEKVAALKAEFANDNGEAGVNFNIIMGIIVTSTITIVLLIIIVSKGTKQKEKKTCQTSHKK